MSGDMARLNPGSAGAPATAAPANANANVDTQATGTQVDTKGFDDKLGDFEDDDDLDNNKKANLR